MDATDKKLLRLLQDDASLPLAVIAERVNLSPNPCWRRIKKLKDAGVIRKEVALLDPTKIRVGVTVFVAIKTSQHNPDWLARFARGIRDIPEIVECYRMSGEVDYMLRVVVPDVKGYDALYKKLIAVAELFDVSSSFAMEQIKYTTALPVDYAD